MFCALVAVSCATPEWSADREVDDFGRSGSDAVRDVESRQNLRFRGADGEEVAIDLTPDDKPIADHPSASWTRPGAGLWYPGSDPLEDLLRGECLGREYELRNGTTTGLNFPIAALCSGMSACERAACELRITNCEIHRLLELSSPGHVSSVWSIQGNGIAEFEVGPQEAAVRAGMAELALRRTVDAIQSIQVPSETGTCAAGNANRDAFLSLWGEHVGLLEEAAESTWERYADLSSEYMSRRTDVQEAALGARSIRLHAAGLIAGEFERKEASDGAVLRGLTCTRGEESAPEAEAMQLLRSVGLEPKQVRDVVNVTNEDIINEVAKRLSEDIGIPVGEGAELLRERGLSIDDIGAARRRLAESMDVFHRDEKAIVREISPDFRVYRATSTLPLTPTWGAYMSEFRPRESLAGSRTGAVAARWSWAYRTPAWATTSLVRQRALQILEESRVVIVRRQSVGSYEVMPYALPGATPYNPEDFLLVVESERAVACAVTGHHDGLACKPFDSDVRPHARLSTRFDYPIFSVSASQPTAAYLLERREGTKSFELGAYRIVGVTTLGLPGDYEDFVWEEGWHRRLDEGLRPSPQWCTDMEEPCGDSRVGGRLPLEDELTDDGDAFESSWRRYLALARAAADNADDLGEQALRTRLDLATRAEDAQANLEALCGVSISLSPLLEALEAQPSAAPEDLIASLAGSDVDMGRLRECLGSDRLMRYVALGTTDLCVWSDPNDPTALCGESQDDSPRCPRVAVGAEDCSEGVPPGQRGWRVQDQPASSTPRDGLLSLFVPQEPGSGEGEEEATAELCTTFRELSRNRGGSETALRAAWEELLSREDASFWSPANLHAIAPSLTWEATLGSHSRIVVSGRPLVSTGSILNEGACTPRADCAGNTTSIFCQSTACASERDRALLNTRLARAATVARWLGQTDLTGFVVPEYRGSRPGSGTVEVSFYGVPEDWAVYSYSTSRNPSATQYSQNDGDPHSLWIWARTALGGYAPADVCGEYWDGTSAWSPSQVDQCDAFRSQGNSVGFAEISGRYPFGGSSDRFSGRARNLTAHQARAKDLLVHLPDSILTQHTPGWVETACQSSGEGAECNESDTGYAFPWYHAVNGREGSVWQNGAYGGARDLMKADFAVRYFLDLGTYQTSYGPEPVTILPEESVYDALELLCEASLVSSSGSTDIDLSGIDSRNAVAAAEALLSARANDISDRFATVVFSRFPESSFEAMKRTGGGERVVPGGTYGEASERFRSAAEEFSAVPREIASALRDSARAMRSLNNALKRADNQAAIVRIMTQSNIADRAASCAVAALGTVGSSTPRGVAVATAAAAVVCANTILQTVYAFAKQAKELDNVRLSRDDAFIEYETLSQRAMDQLNALETRANSMVAELDASLIALESIRANARRNLNQAIYLTSDESVPAFSVNGALRGRLSTEYTRYEAARRNAIDMSILAKRAIEQRFGLRLASLEQDMQLVAAPARWQADICTMEAMTAGESDEDLFDYADRYVGSYVDQLEAFVESYRLDYPFQSASDEMVVSWRDDIANVRAPCEVLSANLLPQSDDLSFEETSEEAGWTAANCVEGADGTRLPGCVAARRSEEVGPELGRSDGTAPRAFVVEFAPLAADACINGPSAPGCPCEGVVGCGFANGVSWGRDVALEPGQYRLSWFQRDTTRADTLRVTGESGSVLNGSYQFFSSEYFSAGSYLTSDWVRVVTTFDVADPAVVRVEVTAAPAPQAPGRYLVAGVLLEDATGAIPGSEFEAGPWVPASSEGTASLPVCEDTDGTVFRRTQWHRGDGFWETSLYITQDQIDRGAVFGRAGFAADNFNYRVESIGLNFVGSEVLSCEESSLPSTCYSSGSVSYSLDHDGPFVVRNHRGEEYQAPLFDGSIEHARGLAAERYLTNPISSADRALLEPYMQTQFRGRPLTGRYRLRVWDRDGFRFANLEDVQVVIRYRHWTRFR